MSGLKVEEIVKNIGAELVNGDIKFECKSFSKDTRTIQKGDTYIGIKGENFDGNLFWREALEKGADCVIVSGIEYKKQDLEKFKDKTILKVEDTLKALYQITKLKRSLYEIPVIAITGSVGKTSTKDIISNVVSQKYKTLKTIGNNNNYIGLCFTILRLQDEEAMVLEMGMNQLREIALLSEIAKPHICVITNIGTSHIGNLGSRENILKAKLEILEGAQDPIVIVNNDNDLLHKWQEENKKEKDIVTYGIKEKSDINATNIVLKQEESEFECNLCQDNIKVKVPVGGEHFVLNALSAICVGKVLKIENSKILEGIKSFELTKKRMEIINLKNEVKIINDSYNASLESIKASLKYLMNCKGNRRIAVLGDILELGDYSEELHRQVGKEVGKSKIDILICRGEKSNYIIEEAKKLGMKEKNIYYLKDNEEIVKKVTEIIEPKDIILLKASNGMKFFDIAENLKTILL